jgi:hypothetical protein
MSTYTIVLLDLDFSGSFLEVAEKYQSLYKMVGGEDGWGYMISVYRHGELIDMPDMMAGMRKLFA